MLPIMVSNGRFTFVPRFLNLAGGVLFLAGLAYFARRFCRDRDNTYLLFTAYCLLFAVGGLTFRLSGLWGVGWWLSHVVRLAAYVVAFGYVSLNTSAEYLRLTETLAERRRAEEELEGLNKHLESGLRELERANKELQEFAYITAHDLKTPLRGIGTLAHWISTDYADKFDEQGREQVRLLVLRAKRMSALIDGILQYSGLGREEPQTQRVDLNTVLSEVIAGIDPPGHIEIKPENEFPTLTCDRAQVMQVFQNLIGNAVKYMDKARGQIRLGCVEQDDSWRFSVADNGPGIEQRHFMRIFQMFQTLAPRKDVESTGIGLAIVKKVVELNGGKAWVESTPGEGSTFFFTWPRPIDD
jgi:light-regulated signal transduction histidine kinase (bacteriophytochrome)